MAQSPECKILDAMAEVIRTSTVDVDVVRKPVPKDPEKLDDPDYLKALADWKIAAPIQWEENQTKVVIAARDPEKPRPKRVYLVVAGSLATRETQAIDQDPGTRTMGRDIWSIEVDVQIPSQRDVCAAEEEDVRVSELSIEGPLSYVTEVEAALLTRWEHFPAFYTGPERFPDREDPEIQRLDDLREWVACHRSDSNLVSIDWPPEQTPRLTLVNQTWRTTYDRPSPFDV